MVAFRWFCSRPKKAALCFIRFYHFFFLFFFFTTLCMSFVIYSGDIPSGFQTLKSVEDISHFVSHNSQRYVYSCTISTSTDRMPRGRTKRVLFATYRYIKYLIYRVPRSSCSVPFVISCWMVLRNSFTHLPWYLRLRIGM